MVANMQRTTSAKETAREVIIHMAKIHVLTVGNRNIQNPTINCCVNSCEFFFISYFFTSNLNLRFKHCPKHQLRQFMLESVPLVAWERSF